MKVSELIKNEELLTALNEAETEEAFTEVLVNNGVDVQEFLDYMNNAGKNGELSEDELDEVAGGCFALFQRVASKFQYKRDTGAWFAKTTVNKADMSITVTDRFGNQASKTYYYG